MRNALLRDRLPTDYRHVDWLYLRYEGEDAAAAARTAAERRELLDQQRGEAIMLGNEFAEVRVRRVETRNGSRLRRTVEATMRRAPAG